MSDPRASVEYMFDTDRPGSVFAAVSPPADVAASPAEPHRVPLERVEAQICELAGHLAAATCRFLVLLADFDARRGWAPPGSPWGGGSARSASGRAPGPRRPAGSWSCSPISTPAAAGPAGR